MTINKFVFEQLAFKDAFKFTTSGTPFYTTADFDQAIADAQAKLKLQVDAFKRIEKVYKDKNTLEGLPQSKKREKTGTLPFSITLNQKNGSQTLIYSKQREASPFNHKCNFRRLRYGRTIAGKRTLPTFVNLAALA